MVIVGERVIGVWILCGFCGLCLSPFGVLVFACACVRVFVFVCGNIIYRTSLKKAK